MDRAGLEQAERLVLDYLEARQSFEIDAQRLLDAAERAGSYAPAIDEIQRRYEAMAKAHFSSGIIKRRLRSAFGNPPSVDPKRTKVESIHARGHRIVVTTSELGQESEPETFEYILEREEHRGLVIGDRRTRDWGGRWIHRVL